MSLGNAVNTIIIMTQLVMVSGHNATDKMPVYEMPLTFVFGVSGWGFESLGEHFCIGAMLGLAQTHIKRQLVFQFTKVLIITIELGIL